MIISRGVQKKTTPSQPSLLLKYPDKYLILKIRFNLLSNEGLSDSIKLCPIHLYSKQRRVFIRVQVLYSYPKSYSLDESYSGYYLYSYSFGEITININELIQLLDTQHPLLCINFDKNGTKLKLRNKISFYKLKKKNLLRIKENFPCDFLDHMAKKHLNFPILIIY
ncbi:hypothetical protein BpHYR1_002361 [Brachionus plicatilis]|uniref:Uncharacterized protein n=1 Tax=Brachionus plicatilis TaxID=10195 RepID=A0A3M7Q9D6_BRAPC|nr:hypothetical protein BpHYR1_002361 [Brachionus plicatilis]